MTPYYDAAAKLIRRFEGLRLDAYRCPAGVWTVGYGHTKDVLPGLTVTVPEAEALLLEDMDTADEAIRRHCTAYLRNNQRAALISFIFNVGAGAFAKSTLLRKLNQGDHASVPAELLRWNKASGTVLRGLVLRREAEANLWQQAEPRQHVAPVTRVDTPTHPLAEIWGK
jgi:lysozyme